MRVDVGGAPGRAAQKWGWCGECRGAGDENGATVRGGRGVEPARGAGLRVCRVSVQGKCGY